MEVIARVRSGVRVGHAAGGELAPGEALPRIALAPVGELVPRHRGVTVFGKVDAEKLRLGVPDGEDPDRRRADVEADDEVPDHGPGGYEILILSPGLLRHDVDVGGVEPERRRGRTVRHEVHPQELHRDQTLRHAQRRGEEDGHHLADV